MTTDARRQPRIRPAGRSASTVLVAFAALSAAAFVFIAALRSGGSSTPAPELGRADVPTAPTRPGGIITYEVTGKGLFVANGAGETLGTSTFEQLHAEGQVASPTESAVSPDGKWVAGIVRNPDGSVFLGLTSHEQQASKYGGGPRIITQLAGSDDPALVAGGKGPARAVSGVPLVVAWSPDSKMLAFGSITGEPYTLGILRYPEWSQPSIAYSEVSGGYVGELAWSPDGTQLAISTYSMDRLNHSVLIADPNGGNVRILSDGCHITWSPDSQYVAVHRDPGAETGAWVIAAADYADRWAITREVQAFPLTWREV